MKLTVLDLVSALMIAIAAPMTAHAGTLTIYNEDCTKLKGFKIDKQVEVKINGNEGCTHTWVTVIQGHSKVVKLKPTTTKKRNYAGLTYAVDPYMCKYRHKAKGTTFGDQDIHGDQDSRMTCKKNWVGVCQCTKD